MGQLGLASLLLVDLYLEEALPLYCPVLRPQNRSLLSPPPKKVNVSTLIGDGGKVLMIETPYLCPSTSGSPRQHHGSW